MPILAQIQICEFTYNVASTLDLRSAYGEAVHFYRQSMLLIPSEGIAYESIDFVKVLCKLGRLSEAREVRQQEGGPGDSASNVFNSWHH